MNTILNTKENSMETISDFIIHLGAGLGISAPLYQQLGYKQLVLVETSADLVKLLSKKFVHQRNVHIKNSTISAQDESVAFNNYSNPRYGSQLPLEPEFLNNANLHLQETKRVSAITFAQLLDEFKLTNTQYNTLILELNGYEAQFLTSLTLAELSIISKIIVTLQATARYVNQTNAAALNTALMAKGFRLTITETNQRIYEKDGQLSAILQTHAEQLARIENLQHERDVLTRENCILQENLRATTAERDEQAHWHNINNEWAQAPQQETATLKQQLEQEKLNANSTAEAQQQELVKIAEELLRVTKERDEQAHWHQKNKEWAEALQQETATLKQQLEQEKLNANCTAEAQQQELAKITEELLRVTKERDEQAHWHQKNKEWAEALQREIATLKQQFEQEKLNANNTAEAQQQELTKTAEELLRVTKERDEQAHWNQKHKDWAESLKRDIETLKKDYAEGERAQSLALKLQAKAQVDLEHLRNQYQRKLKQEQNLIELIRELQLKLQAAANYYHQLQLQHPELSTESRQGNTNNTIDAEIISKPIESKRARKKRKQDRS